ncbi:MAG: class I SAM-dependent methyltransferase [bacterium]
MRRHRGGRDCSAADIRAQLDYLRAFHRRRLRPGRDADSAELADRADFTQDDAVAIVSCRACGHVFRATRPQADAVAEEYAEDEYGAERLASLFDAQREQFRDKTARLQDLLPESRPSLVEIGSFVGGFLAVAGERGWDCVGVDPGAEVDAFCRRQGFTVHRSTAEAAPIADASVDCVAIWNTFDQLPDPRPTLRAARRWLRPGGCLVVRVPNGAAFRAAITALPGPPAALRPPLLAALAWNNFLGFPYLQGYSLVTLDALLAEFGLQRIAADADMLVRLADEHTRFWARLEEQGLKTLWRLFARQHREAAPWFDVYYRVSPSASR